MKKCLALVFALLAAIPAYGQTAFVLPEDQCPVIDNVLFLPLRQTGEALGYEVTWLAKEKAVWVGSDTYPSVKCTVGSTDCIYGADAVGILPAAAQLIDEKTYVPADFFAGYFPLDVLQTAEGISVAPAAITESLTLKAGESLSLTLAENPTTGYRWSLYAPPALEMTATEFELKQPVMIGTGGYRTWTFTSQTPGTYELRFVYERSWEAGKAVLVNRYSLTVE